MFGTCCHEEIATSLETIAAAFVILSYRQSMTPGGASLVSANSLFEQVSNKPVLDCIGLALEDFLPRDIEEQMRPCLASCVTRQCPHECELVTEQESQSRWWRLVVSPILPNQAENQRMIVTLTEITEKKRLEQQLKVVSERYEGVVEAAYDGVLSIDQDQNITMINNSFRRIFGIGNENVIGENLSRFLPKQYRENHERHVNSFSQSPVNVRPMQFRHPIRGLRLDGSEIDIEASLSKIKVENKVEMTAVIRDISEQTKLIQQLQQAATHDELTGIFNRRHGLVVLNNEIHRCRRFGHELSVVMIDLDHFKEINDAHGHACGDHALTSVATTLLKALRNADTLCRWGGEEFLVILPETTLNDAFLWAQRARTSIAQDDIFCSAEHPVIRTTASMGVASLTSADDIPDDLLKRADDALYQVKNSGRNQVLVAQLQRQKF